MTPELSQINELRRKVNVALRQARCGEVLYSLTALSGAVPCNYKLGVDASTGDLYYKDDNNTWQLAISGGGGGGGGIESIVAGTGITVDDSDPLNPIVSATGGGGGGGIPNILKVVQIDDKIGLGYNIKNSSEDVTGLEDGSTEITSADFALAITMVFIGNVFIPNYDQGFGDNFYTKALDQDTIVLNSPLNTGDDITIFAFKYLTDGGGGGGGGGDNTLTLQQAYDNADGDPVLNIDTDDFSIVNASALNIDSSFGQPVRFRLRNGGTEVANFVADGVNNSLSITNDDNNSLKVGIGTLEPEGVLDAQYDSGINRFLFNPEGHLAYCLLNGTDDGWAMNANPDDDRSAIWRVSGENSVFMDTNGTAIEASSNRGIGLGGPPQGNGRIDLFQETHMTQMVHFEQGITFPFNIINTGYTVGTSDYTIAVNNGATNIVVTLPDAGAQPNRLVIVKRYDNTSTGVVEIISESSNVQDSDGSFVTSSTLLAAVGSYGESKTFQSDGTNWHCIAH